MISYDTMCCCAPQARVYYYYYIATTAVLLLCCCCMIHHYVYVGSLSARDGEIINCIPGVLFFFTPLFYAAPELYVRENERFCSTSGKGQV